MAVKTIGENENLTEIPVNTLKQLCVKHQAFALLKAQGLNNTEAGKAIGVRPATARVISHKINKLSLKHPEMVKSANAKIKEIIEQKPLEVERSKVDKDGKTIDFIEKIYPTHTNALAASIAVYDRFEPAINKNVNLNLDAAIAPVDLDILESHFSYNGNSDESLEKP